MKLTLEVVGKFPRGKVPNKLLVEEKGGTMTLLKNDDIIGYVWGTHGGVK